ncbi:MAG: mechanosensitive ion channel [Anaerolineae bacterium]|nr:mechanosensitive ion channel [Anaerolineae bacterium]MBL6966000.1 mechanosensitive ion channel [Anaerolineales bacterium]
MIDQIRNYLLLYPGLVNLLRIAIFFMLAWVISRIIIWMIRRTSKMGRIKIVSNISRPERQETLRSLAISLVSFSAFLGASIATLALFVDIDTLVWMVGLFSAAIGLGARPLFSDFLTGIGFIFEDTFAVGEKVEILEMEGVVEKINLRNTWMRSPTGEVYIIPNGEIRMLRNFSRGKFSAASVTVKLQAVDLGHALVVLEELAEEAVVLLPNLLEPWQVISKEAVIGQQAELTLLTKARFGMAAEMRPRLQALVQERLADADIELID